MKRSLALTEAGTHVRWEGGALQVVRPGQGPVTVPIDTVQEVILVGRIEITSTLVRKCIRENIPVILLDGLGRYLGRVVGATRRHAVLRIAQVQAAVTPSRALSIVRVVVGTKIANQRALLLRRQRTLQDPDIARVLVRLRLIEADLDKATDVDMLRGYEGAAAAAYFGVFGRLIRNPTFSFEGRNRRPPRDPVNAMLSFGYTVLGSLVEGEVEAAGLDPAVGFLHLPHYGRPSLMLDLLEELRPVVDRLTLRLINRGQLTPNDFGPPEGLDENGFDDLAPPSPGAARTGVNSVWPDAPEDIPFDTPASLDLLGQSESATSDVSVGGSPPTDIALRLEPGLMAASIGPAGSPSLKGAVYLRAGGRKLFLAALFEQLRDPVFDPVDDQQIPLRLAMRRQVWRLVQAIQDPQLPYLGLRIE